MLKALSVSNDLPDSKSFWHNKRMLVTGGAGFLGTYVVQKLRERGAAEIIAPRSSQYDRRDICAIRQLLRDTSRAAVNSQQLSVIRLRSAVCGLPSIWSFTSPRVGGIGANREHSAEFFYDNPSTGSGQAQGRLLRRRSGQMPMPRPPPRPMKMSLRGGR